MVDIAELRAVVDRHHEWLLVRELGRTFPLDCREIEIERRHHVTRFGFLDDEGFHSWRLVEFVVENGEVKLAVACGPNRRCETVRLVPRTSAAALAAEVELARLTKANEIARLIKESSPGIKLGRVALNSETGRLAQIIFDTAERVPTAATADLTGAVTIEAIFTSAMRWLETLGRRKRPVLDIWIICERKQAKQAQKLHALLSERWKDKIAVKEIDRKAEPPRLIDLRKRRLSELWREKPPKLSVMHEANVSETARSIMDLAPDEIDRVVSRQGETLRYAGLPFARVRVILGNERAWFGPGRALRPLNPQTWGDLVELVAKLKARRTFETDNKRHDKFRSAPEAWLESILRRDINLLDANLVLSPIYHQFRFAGDKVDLLALRKDGRLVIIELKTQPDREMIFQAADYWRKIELQRRSGLLSRADLFSGREIASKPAIVYLVAPAWSFHRDFEYFARAISPEIELWRFDLHENWREKVRVISRQTYS